MIMISIIYYLFLVGGGSNILRKGVRAMQGVYDIKDKVPETGDIGRKGVTPSPPTFKHHNKQISKHKNKLFPTQVDTLYTNLKLNRCNKFVQITYTFFVLSF